MLPLIALTSSILNESDINLDERQYYIPRFINQCYGRQNILTVNIDIGQICIDVDLTNNKFCNQFPKGVYLDISFSNLPGIVIRAVIQDFNYETTSQICFSCPGTNSSCRFIEQTQAALVKIKSLTWQTEIFIGKIFISHSQYSQCFDSTESELFWSKNAANIILQRTFKCPDLGSQFDRFSFKMIQTDGLEDQMLVDGVDQDGNSIYDLQEVNGKIQITINYDFSEYYIKSYNFMTLEIHSNIEGVMIIRKTDISLIQSSDLPVMYDNPIFTIWADRFDLTADQLPNADELDQLYCQNLQKVQIRYQVFNKITGLTINNLFFWISDFTFQKIKLRTRCNDESDEGKCSILLHFLQQYDIFTVDILVHYYFYNKKGIMYFYSSNLVSQVENICWSQIEAYYLTGQICGSFQVNPYSLQCQYLTPQNTQVSVFIDNFTIVKNLNYSTQITKICFQSGKESFRLQKLFKQNSTVIFRFFSNDREIIVAAMKTFNQDYSKLKKILFIFGMVCLGIIIILFSVYIPRYKNKLIRIRKIKQQEFDDI